VRAGELAAFEREPYAADACRVRRWDDLAEDPAVQPPPFSRFTQLLRELAS
jgi:predicted HD phosphohydrolase